MTTTKAHPSDYRTKSPIPQTCGIDCGIGIKGPENNNQQKPPAQRVTEQGGTHNNQLHHSGRKQ